MDAVKLIKEAMRMCATYRKNSMKKYHGSCTEFKEKDPERYVETVEKWSAEHPPKTRQSEFLKAFPNAMIGELSGTIIIDPCTIDTVNYPRGKDIGWCEKKFSCSECRREYWLAEVDG